MLLLNYLIFFSVIHIVFARIHTLETTNDLRKVIPLSTFGFIIGGHLEVKLKNFKATPENNSATFGFSLDRTITDGMAGEFNDNLDKCVLLDYDQEQFKKSAIHFILNLKDKQFQVKCRNQKMVNIYESQEKVEKTKILPGCNNAKFSLTYKNVANKYTLYNASFYMSIDGIDGQGLYNLYFHNCPNYSPTGPETAVDFEIEIKEQNNDNNYLSAGEMPLPALYCMMSVLFLLSGMFLVFLLKQSRHPVFKIHYMMVVLVFIKAISLAFHGVNYHYIQTLGVHLATWAILFYVAHLLKGALFFVVLVLVGTGWTFIKHVLTPRDKRLFMVVIPLQVLANIAQIILEESEESDREYLAWRNIVIFVDLICCFCIMFPVVWSIRHLQEASQTDGKAAINLRKLKLFRQFYIMILCYIYSTRIMIYLLKMTVPFQYSWLQEMFREMATYVFFVLTAYKFRPASHNPYFTVNCNEDDENEDDRVLTESGVTEGLKKINFRSSKSTLTTLMEVTEDERDALLNQTESSHEYD